MAYLFEHLEYFFASAIIMKEAQEHFDGDAVTAVFLDETQARKTAAKMGLQVAPYFCNTGFRTTFTVRSDDDTNENTVAVFALGIMESAIAEMLPGLDAWDFFETLADQNARRKEAIWRNYLAAPEI